MGNNSIWGGSFFLDFPLEKISYINTDLDNFRIDATDFTFADSLLPAGLVVYINGLTSKVGPELVFSAVDSSDPLKYDDGSLYIGPAFVFDATNVLLFSNPGAIGTTQVDTSGTIGGNGYSVEMNESLLECYRGRYVSEGVYEPIPMTTATLVKMGVGSADLTTTNTFYNIVTVNDRGGVNGMQMFARNIGDYLNLTYSHDGISYIPMTKDWDKGEYHLRLVQVSEDGLFFRAGYRRYSSEGVAIDANIVYSAWVTYDGSFNPVDYIRFGYGITVPIGLKQFQQWNKLATDEEILRLIEIDTSIITERGWSDLQYFSDGSYFTN